MTTTIGRRRAALLMLFFIPGLFLSSWVTRTPAVRDLLGASTAEMGLVLFGLSAGSMVAVLGSGALIARFGTRRVITVGVVSQLISMPLVGIGATTSQSLVVSIGLCLFGIGIGGSEVAINIEGADVERILGRPVLPTLHGFFSLGTVFGAGVGLVLAAVDFPVLWHMLAAAAIGVPLMILARAWMGAGLGQDAAADGESGGARLWRDRQLLLIGVIVLALALAEGAANDWLPLLMVDGHGLDPALSSLVYLTFVAAMALGRFTGGWFLARFSRPVVLGASAVIGAVGLVIVVAVDNAVVAGAAVIFWGLGAALGFPVALSAAADSGPNATARVSLVASIAYVAFLAGPPALGFLGDHFGLRGAMVAVLVFLAIAAVAAPALRSSPHQDLSSGTPGELTPADRAH
ncbi:MFS transporter [Actinoplanes sp. NPDC051851]|uniref:MFS transporter n=1 Tax=Actinoplanes sp. NPDC051851 TaxID=3154753 RepID=UPI00342222A2